jgi:hypothetical protein
MFFCTVPNTLNIYDYLAAGSSDAYIFATQEIR